MFNNSFFLGYLLGSVSKDSNNNDEGIPLSFIFFFFLNGISIIVLVYTFGGSFNISYLNVFFALISFAVINPFFYFLLYIISDKTSNFINTRFIKHDTIFYFLNIALFYSIGIFFFNASEEQTKIYSFTQSVGGILCIIFIGFLIEFFADPKPRKSSYIKKQNEYIGDIVDGQRHGYGQLIYTNGDVYTGEFKHNLFHGKGQYTYSSGKVQKGIWEHGIFAQ